MPCAACSARSCLHGSLLIRLVLMQQSNQSVFVNMEVTTVAAESVGQLLSSQNGFEGIQVRALLPCSPMPYTTPHLHLHLLLLLYQNPCSAGSQIFAASRKHVLTLDSCAQRYFLQNPQIFSSITLSGPPTITTYSASNTSVASSPKTSSSACTGSHHFGHWCHTSISRGGIIAIIVIFSLLVLVLLIAIPVCLMGMARSRRTRTYAAPFLLVTLLPAL